MLFSTLIISYLVIPQSVVLRNIKISPSEPLSYCLTASSKAAAPRVCNLEGITPF